MKCNVLIDWLTFSVRDCYDPLRVINWYLGMDCTLFQEQPYGLDGYERCMEFNGIKVLYQPRQNMDFQSMGVCVSMSGTGCRTFENHTKMFLDDAHDEQGTGYTAFPNLFQIICANNCNVSRIDIACDDHDGALNMDDIVESVMNNDVCTRMQKRQVVLSYDGVDKNGTTVYFGAPSSDFRVRIYDKAKEQGDLVSHWVRVELVFKGKNALAFVQNFVHCDSIGTLASGVINDKFRFIDRDDTNISRCSTCGWWVEFMENLTAVEIFSREVVDHPIEEIEDWALRQLAPSLGMLFKAKGSLWLADFLKQGQERLTQKQLNLVNDYRNSRLNGFHTGIYESNVWEQRMHYISDCCDLEAV